MTVQTVAAPVRKRREAVVWIDHEQAVVVEHGFDRMPEVGILLREAMEPESAFEGRAVDQVLEDERVVVTGPAYARTDFERAYVAVTHRPDRLVDVEPTTNNAAESGWPAPRR